MWISGEEVEVRMWCREEEGEGVVVVVVGRGGWWGKVEVRMWCREEEEEEEGEGVVVVGRGGWRGKVEVRIGQQLEAVCGHVVCAAKVCVFVVKIRNNNYRLIVQLIRNRLFVQIRNRLIVQLIRNRLFVQNS